MANGENSCHTVGASNPCNRMANNEMEGGGGVVVEESLFDMAVATAVVVVVDEKDDDDDDVDIKSDDVRYGRTVWLPQWLVRGGDIHKQFCNNHRRRKIDVDIWENAVVVVAAVADVDFFLKCCIDLEI